MRCPKSRFPIWIIVFDELELIIFVSQGLTLSTASLVIIICDVSVFLVHVKTILIKLKMSFIHENSKNITLLNNKNFIELV